MNAPALLTVKQFSSRHPAFSESSLRWIIHNSEHRKNSAGEQLPVNGFSPAIFRVGRRVLLDEGKFFEIVQSQNSSIAA